MVPQEKGFVFFFFIARAVDWLARPVLSPVFLPHSDAVFRLRFLCVSPVSCGLGIFFWRDKVLESCVITLFFPSSWALNRWEVQLIVRLWSPILLLKLFYSALPRFTTIEPILSLRRWTHFLSGLRWFVF